jgi:hypothetical protein
MPTKNYLVATLAIGLFTLQFERETCAQETAAPPAVKRSEYKPLYRILTKQGLHIFTCSEGEVDIHARLGNKMESVLGYIVKHEASDTVPLVKYLHPVHRTYWHYTTIQRPVEISPSVELIQVGWTFRTPANDRIRIYHLRNPKTQEELLTENASEVRHLTKLGWHEKQTNILALQRSSPLVRKEEQKLKVNIKRWKMESAVASTQPRPAKPIRSDAGTVQWIWERNRVGLSLKSSPAIGADGTIYVGTPFGWIYALDGKTGAQKWGAQIGTAEVHSAPAIGADGTIYVGSDDGFICALDEHNGGKKWAFQTGDVVRSSPAIGADGTIYVSSYDGCIYALNGRTGAQKWAVQTGRLLHSSPAIGADGTIYVGTYNDKTIALDGKTGATKWVVKTVGFQYSSPAIGADGTVYIGCHGGWNRFIALDGKTGAEKWKYSTWKTGRLTSSPVIGVDGTVYVDFGGNHLIAFDGQTGHIKWQIGNRGGIRFAGSPTIGDDGTVYMAPFRGGHVYALNGQTGAKEWALSLIDEHVLQASTFNLIGADGTLYVTSETGIIAIKTNSSGPAKSPWPMFGKNPQRTGRAAK